MWTNNIKGNSESNSSYENTIFDKIEQILDWKITKSELDSMSKKYGFKKTIDDILNKYSDTKKLAIFIMSEINPDIFKTHLELHNDLDVVKLAIQKNSNLYYSIATKLKNNEVIWQEMIKSMIRENKNFFDVELFINSYFVKNSKKLFDFYFIYLDKANNHLSNDLSKNLFELKQSNLDLYTHLNENKLFITKWKNITINNSFIKQFNIEVNKDSIFRWLDQNEKNVFIINKLITYFGVSYSSLWPEEKNIFDLVLNLINIQISKEIKEKNKKLEEKDIDFEEKNIETSTELSDYEDDEFNDFADFSYPECNSYRVTGGYNIETITWKKIFITNTEKDKFTTKALKNYIKFHNTMRNLWLNFLWDKYSHDFKILCNNKIWVNYMLWEWITDSKMLSILNMIWRNVWVPEHRVLDEKWKETNSIKCFKTLWDAKEAFWEIKETWMINDKKYSDWSTFWNWAVENKLIEVLCIDQKGNGLNISKWK